MKVLFVFLFILSAWNINCQTKKIISAQLVAELLSEKAFTGAELGIYIKNISKNEVLVAHQSDRLMTPASILKVKTAVDALIQLGPNFQFESHIQLSGEQNNNALDGNIRLQGGGDPTWESELDGAVKIETIGRDIVNELRRRGILCINDIHIDASHVSLPGVPRGYPWEDVANYYGAGVYGVNIQENAYELKMIRGKDGKVTLLSFDSLAIDKVSMDVIAKGMSDQAYIFYHPDGTTVHVQGQIPIGSREFTIKGAIRNPPLYAGRRLFQYVERGGIQILGGIKVFFNEAEPKNQSVWNHSYFSPRLKEILKPVLFKSNNMFAQAIFREMHQENVEENQRYFLEDGSGLSPTNRISAKQLLASFESAFEAGLIPLLYDLLPENGKEGNVKSVLKKRPGALRLKSGSIGGVKSYMGLTTNRDGDVIGFVCIANELVPGKGSASRAWEVLLNDIASW